MWEDLAVSLGALIPSLGVLALFLVVLRAIVLADRRERTQRLREDAILEREKRTDGEITSTDEDVPPR